MAINIQSLSSKIRSRLEEERDEDMIVDDFQVVSKSTSDPLQSSIQKVTSTPKYAQSQPTGLAKNIIKNLPQTATKSLIEFGQKEAEAKKDMSFVDQFKRDWGRAAKTLIVDLPRVVLGGVNSAVETVMEEFDVRVMGFDREETRKFSDSDPKMDQLLFGGESKSWQQTTEQVDQFVQKSELATDWEKKNLAPLIGVIGFVSDAWIGGGGGAKKKVASEVVEQLAKETDEAIIKTTLKNIDMPTQLIDDIAPQISKATTKEEVDTIVKQGAQSIVKKAETEIPQEAAERYLKKADDTLVDVADDVAKTVDGAVDDVIPMRRITNEGTEPLNLFRGSSGKVTQTAKQFDEVLEIKGDQHQAIRFFANQGDRGAQKILDNPINFYVKADSFMRRKFGDQFDAVRYTNEVRLPQKGIEYHDLRTNEFFSEKEEVAQVYAMQNRRGKYDDTATKQAVDEAAGSVDLERPTTQVPASRFSTTAKETERTARKTKLVTIKADSGEVGIKTPFKNLTPEQKIQFKEVNDTNVFKTPTKKTSSPEALKEFTDNRGKIAKMKDAILEQVQDDMIRVRNLVNDNKLKITNESNPYDAEIAFHGRIGSRIEDIKQTTKKIDMDIIDISKKVKVPDEQLTKEVNDYLLTRHAPERNKALGDGAAGISTNEAQLRQAQLEALPYAKEVRRVADQIQELNNTTLDILKEGSVISDELYDLLKKKYKNHVPLQRVMGTDEDFGGAMAKGFDVTGAGIKRAKGSDREVADILGNVAYNVEQAIIRSEKNRVDLSTLKMVRDNKQTFAGIIDEVRAPIVPVANEPVEKLIDPILHKQLVGFAEKHGVEVINQKTLKKGNKQLFGAMQSINKDEKFRVKLRAASDEKTFAHEMGHVIDAKWKKFDDKALKGLDTELNKIAEMRASKELLDADPEFSSYVKSRDEKIAEAVSIYLTDKEVMEKIAPKTKEFLEKVFSSDNDLKEILNFQRSRQREIIQIDNTIFRPDPSRLYNDPRVLSLRENGKPVFLEIKDPQLAVALRGVGREKLSGMLRGVGAVTRLYSGIHTRFNPEFAFSNKIRDIQEVLVYTASQSEVGVRGSGKFLAKEAKLQNTKAVLDHIRGKDSEGAKMYQQMRMDGGTTGGLGLSTKKSVELDIENIRKVNRSNPRKAAQSILEYVDYWNTVFEDSSRLSVYSTALENGSSRQRAAVLAKESSVNFNKFGKQGQIINALYMFSNASIQGTVKTVRAMKNPKVAATVGTAVFGSVYAVAQWNDSVDEDWRNKITTWDRLNSLAIMLPSKEGDGEGVRYVTIPVAWGIKPMKVMADEFVDLQSGNSEGVASAMSSVLTAALEAYNPAGGSDLMSSVTPTILDMPLDIARNQAWHGGAIKPDWDRNASPSIQYFSSLRDSATGRAFVGISKGLSGVGIEISPADINYSYEQIIGGAGRFVNKTVNTMTAIGGNEPVPTKEIPVVSRFYKNIPIEETGRDGGIWDFIQNVERERSVSNFYLKQQAEDSLQQLNNIPKEDAGRLFEEIREADPELAKKIVDLKKQQDKGLTFEQRAILNLGVASGDRAKVLLKMFDQLETKEDKANLWNEYRQKGIISDTVSKQLKDLIKQ